MGSDVVGLSVGSGVGFNVTLIASTMAWISPVLPSCPGCRGCPTEKSFK